MLMEKRMYIALIFVAAFLCSYAQQSDKSTYLAHIRQADSLYMAGDPAGEPGIRSSLLSDRTHTTLSFIQCSLRCG